MPLQEPLEILARSGDGPTNASCFATVSRKRFIGQVALFLRPLVEEIKDIIKAGDLLNEVPALSIKWFVEHSERDGDPPFSSARMVEQWRPALPDRPFFQRIGFA
ncbi:hypothetical protein J2T09_004886 [Neorhizobium huautlense]|uniref:Uncharacterized protein n=1 Tax=Neorhizobium huautlense TaxID=67774 RepID=A0ABT9Q055_9HYPH|nr:hypothetical protein [Neorhizobium huautlense]